MRMVPKSCRHAVTLDDAVVIREGHIGLSIHTTTMCANPLENWQKLTKKTQAISIIWHSGFKIPCFQRSRKVNDRNAQSSWKLEFCFLKVTISFVWHLNVCTFLTLPLPRVHYFVVWSFLFICIYAGWLVQGQPHGCLLKKRLDS